MNMPKVSECEVLECAYNQDKKCHTMAITVGDGDHPMCDTFLKASHKGGDRKVIGGVGACKVETCRHNDSFECMAKNIHVGHHMDHADCTTFEKR